MDRDPRDIIADELRSNVNVPMLPNLAVVVDDILDALTREGYQTTRQPTAADYLAIALHARLG